MTNLALDNKCSDINALISETDIRFLVALYKMRCLSEDIAFRFFYSKTRPYEPYCHGCLSYLEKLGLIEIVVFSDSESHAIFLKALGVRFVTRHINPEESGIVCSRWDETRQKIIDFSVSASDLKIKKQLIKHQLALNYFVLEFKERADQQGLNYQYYDLLFAPKCSDKMSPDGVLIIENQIYLLEMDMGTEHADKLTNRWNNYRSFFARPQAFFEEKPITVVFILANAKGTFARTNTFIRTVCSSGLISDISGVNELYTLPPEQAKELLFRKSEDRNKPDTAYEPIMRYFSVECGLKISTANFTKKACSIPFGYCIGKTAGGSSAPLILDGKRQEYLFDFWFDGRYSVLYKILYLERTNYLMRRSALNREFSYIVAVPSIKYIANIVKYSDVKDLSNIYFITPDRIGTRKPIYEAVFSIDKNMNLRHFTDYSLTTTVYEHKAK